MTDELGWTRNADGTWTGPTSALCPYGCGEITGDGCTCDKQVVARLDPDTPLDALPDTYGDDHDPAGCGCLDCEEELDVAAWELEITEVAR